MKDLHILNEWGEYRLCLVSHYSDESNKAHVIYNKLTGITDKRVALSYGTFKSDNLITFHNLNRIKDTLKQQHENKIAELKSKLKSTNRADYSDELEEEYNRLKEQIVRTAENMIEDLEYNDENFENRLKAICDLKKQLFSIPCDGAREARKFNGKIKFEINKANRLFDEQMMLLDVDLFKGALK